MPRTMIKPGVNARGAASTLLSDLEQTQQALDARWDKIEGALSPTAPGEPATSTRLWALLGLTLAAFLVVAELLLAAETHGLLAVPALVLAVVIAPFAHYHEAPVLRTLALGVIVSAAAVAVIELPGAIPEPRSTAMLWGTRVVLGSGCVVLLGKVLLLHRFSACHRAKPRRDAKDEHDRLLPFQRDVLGQIEEAIWLAKFRDEAHLIQLQGRFGESKSFLLDRLDLLLNRPANAQPADSRLPGDHAAVVNVNVWAYQSEPDLFLAIVEEILGHWRYWYPYGWLRYPLILFLARTAKESKLAFKSALGTEAEVQVPLGLPRPTGQRALERLAARVRAHGGRTVVVLDEVDRAAPQVAQAAASLALNSLRIPGVVVVLSYVDEVMRYKVFNPLIPTIPDIASTMQALIFSDGPDQATKENRGGRLHPESGASEDSLARWPVFGTLTKAKNNHEAGMYRFALNQEPLKLEAVPLDDLLKLGWAWASPGDRLRLQNRMAERYLATHPIRIPKPGNNDLAAMLLRFETISALVAHLLGRSLEELKQPTVRDALTTAVTKALENWQDRMKPNLDMAPIRRLEGEVFRRLSALRRQSPPARSVAFIAAVVVVAYQAAYEDYWR